MALVAVLHVLDPDRDPVSITVSEYVLGPHGWLLSVATTTHTPWPRWLAVAGGVRRAAARERLT